MGYSQGMFIGALALVGLVVGSSLNVVIVRVPAGESAFSPRSKCPNCVTERSTRDSIPLLGWILLRGSCRTCAMPISVRFPIVELVTALVWAGLTAHAFAAGILGLLPLLLVSSAILIALFVIDLEHKRLPDALTYLMYPVAAVGLLVDGLITGSWQGGSALVGAGIWLMSIGGIWLLSGGRGMGMGDVKLAPTLGLILGWVGVGSSVVGLMSAWLIGGFVAITLMLTRRARKGTTIPFGPFLIVGFAVGLLFGADITEAYLDSLGL